MNRSKIEAFIGSEDQSIFFIPTKLQNSEWYLKYAKKPSRILSLLCWTGLLEDSDKTSRKRIIARILPVSLILITVDIIVTCMIPANTDFFRTAIYLCNYIMSVLIWFAMRRRRKQLTTFLRLLHEIQRQAMTWKISLTLYGICISSVAAASLNAIRRSRPQMAAQQAYG
ncbi:hypothetical protein AVEN_3028-1 [Araneus ventricosus]|uniref:Uncharacterized protein n=1 Tax=Araneus ventricosus TaxID=182803 RepID=A0A4Y2UN91_ARAVE|nr:hypothetical protein AVEN_3028-1 [Araneus ventricosus]